jgi:hypothetical protein
MEKINHFHIRNLWRYVSDSANRRNVLKNCDFNELLRNFFDANDLISKKGMLSVLLYFSLDGLFRVEYFYFVSDDKSCFMKDEFFVGMIKLFKKHENENLWLIGARLLRLLFLNKAFGDYYLDVLGSEVKENKLAQVLLGIVKNEDYNELLRKEVMLIYSLLICYIGQSMC